MAKNNDQSERPTVGQNTSLTPPLDPTIAAWLTTLDDNAVELFHERAGIREYEGGLSRREAEAEACLDVKRWLMANSTLPLSTVAEFNEPATPSANTGHGPEP